MKKYLLDANVLLDFFLKRTPWAVDVACIWDAHRKGTIRAFIAAFSVPTIFYIVRRQVGMTTAQMVVQGCLATLEIAPVDHATLLAAQGLTGPDFEDNLQIACAIAIGVDAIVTRDPRGFVAAPLPVLAPADVVASLSVPPTQITP